MDTNIVFQYGVRDVLDAVDAETSRHAAFLRFQDGGSAYDALKIHTNDEPAVSGFVSDAFRTLQALFGGECTYGEYDDMHVLGFFLPDFDESAYFSSKREVERFVVLSATYRWLASRSFTDFSQMVSRDADASLNRAVAMLRTRRFPIE